MQYPLFKHSLPLRQSGQYLPTSVRYEVTQFGVAGIKPTLIKCLYNTVVILITIVLALYPLNVGAYVSEQQELTYSPDVLRFDTAGTTQPVVAEVIATTTITNNIIPLSEREVIEEILKVFPDAPIMVEVARCESGLNPLADRSNLNVDVGLFQINQVHLSRLQSLDLDRRDIHDNLTYARMLYDESGLGPWYMSKHCWV